MQMAGIPMRAKYCRAPNVRSCGAPERADSWNSMENPSIGVAMNAKIHVTRIDARTGSRHVGVPRAFTKKRGTRTIIAPIAAHNIVVSSLAIPFGAVYE